MSTEEAASQQHGRPRRPSPTRRWDIDNAILTLLESGPKTTCRLYRLLNPGMRRALVLTARGWKYKPVNVKVDKRVLKRHLGYLIRDSIAAVKTQLKILHHNRGMVSWNVKYYMLQGERGSPPPPGSPLCRPIPFKEIHNPFPGEEGQLRFIRWLRDP